MQVKLFNNSHKAHLLKLKQNQNSYKTPLLTLILLWSKREFKLLITYLGIIINGSENFLR